MLLASANTAPKRVNASRRVRKRRCAAYWRAWRWPIGRGVDQLARILSRKFHVLHIVGGGSKNSLLCQLTANATGLPVVAGPSEATVAGNVLVQALARGYVSGPTEIREIVRRSTEPVEYVPQDTRRYEERYGEYLRILEKALQ